MTDDIVIRLRKTEWWHADCDVRMEAADEIERLRKALRLIANDYVELSQEKAYWQRDDHMKIARKALEK